MVSSSQIILDIIDELGLDIKDVCKKVNITYGNFMTRVKKNRWSLETLKKLSNTLKVDLTSLATDNARYLEEL